MPLQQHLDFVNNAIEFLQNDPRILGIAAGGSWITNSMDEFSDIDLVIAVADNYELEVSKERFTIAEKIGRLLACFTGEHVGEPRLIISLYGPPLLHVDLKFTAVCDIIHRIENPIILWERDAILTNAFTKKQPFYPLPDLQWIEDRFWIWIHYTASKIGRGEIFEAIETLSFLRVTVLGPLALMKNGHLPKGMRYIERDVKEELPLLIKTIPAYNTKECLSALECTITLYRHLRCYHSTANLIVRKEAEALSTLYLANIINKTNNS
jgi:hypothetical protein